MTDAEIAARSGLPEAVIYAIRMVESAGRDPHAMRFEPHLFRRARPDLADRIPYTDSDGDGPSHVDRVAAHTDVAAFERALRLDADAAVRSTSWGAYQVLGGVLLDVVGLPPREAYEAFRRDPDGYSGPCLLAWIQRNPRVRQPAKASPPDFAGIAKAYNGAGAAPKYAERLEHHWREWHAQRDAD